MCESAPECWWVQALVYSKVWGCPQQLMVQKLAKLAPSQWIRSSSAAYAPRPISSQLVPPRQVPLRQELRRQQDASLVKVQNRRLQAVGSDRMSWHSSQALLGSVGSGSY